MTCVGTWCIKLYKLDDGSIRLWEVVPSVTLLPAYCFCVPLSPAGLLNQPKAFATSGYPYLCVCVCVDRITDRYSKVLKGEVLIA